MKFDFCLQALLLILPLETKQKQITVKQKGRLDGLVLVQHQ